jgi:hypothetical protein
MHDLIEIIEDAQILLDRALKNKTVAAFGIDGNGEYGECDFAQYYKILSIIPEAVGEEGGPGGKLQLFFFFELEGYDPDTFGLIYTDQNLKASINEHLQEQIISKTCWVWGPHEYQLSHQIGCIPGSRNLHGFNLGFYMRDLLQY